MKIVSWNCRGGFRNKFKYLLDQDVDIYIIQEYKNPQYNCRMPILQLYQSDY